MVTNLVAETTGRLFFGRSADVQRTFRIDGHVRRHAKHYVTASEFDGLDAMWWAKSLMMVQDVWSA